MLIPFLFVCFVSSIVEMLILKSLIDKCGLKPPPLIFKWSIRRFSALESTVHTNRVIMYIYIYVCRYVCVWHVHVYSMCLCIVCVLYVLCILCAMCIQCRPCRVCLLVLCVLRVVCVFCLFCVLHCVMLCIYIYMYIYIHICICINVYIYMHMYMHDVNMHMHIYMYLSVHPSKERWDWTRQMVTWECS